MYFYEVWVRSNHYHGNEALTYSSNDFLAIGQLVMVSLRNEVVSAVVTKQVKKPKIKLKTITTKLNLTPLPTTTISLMNWLREYYPAPIGVITQQFIPANLNNNADGYKEPKQALLTEKLPQLTSEQQMAITNMKDSNTFLLHGRTGSGKTRLYLELAKQEIAKKRSVIVLTPEISLTTQLELQFSNIFKNKVIVLHSTLTPKQRLQRWTLLLSSVEPVIVIGPRSAIFSPIKNIGLIIVDEEHEPAYKQEQSPYYQTTKVASQLRVIHHAKLVLGSATPLISDYFLAQTRNKPIIRLTTLARQNLMPQLETIIVDCHDRSLFTRSQHLSQTLIDSVQSAINNKQQSLLYLNRRGTARVIVCDQCDWQAICPRCNLPLTYHGDNHSLRCHICGYLINTPVTCPKCDNPSIQYLTIGTKAVVEEINHLFPSAKVQRFDADNLKDDRLEKHYQAIKDGLVDIIVGTQMLAKGLDLPKLSVVGVLLADTSLQLPDFSVNERTYQLLQQVIGRVGRGHITGKAIVQTYQPNNPTILDALEDNWDHFYHSEIQERQQFIFPPFTHLLRLTIQRSTAKKAEVAALKLAESLPDNIKIDGPAPAFHEKQASKFRWQLVIKAPKRSTLLAIIKQLPNNVSYDIDPITLI